MQQNKRKAVNRGVKVELVNARIEMFGTVSESNTGKKFINVAFHIPVDADDANSQEVKLRSTLWEEKAEKVSKSASGARYNVSGFLKVGKPWEKDGRKIVSNEFVVSTITPLSKTTSSQAPASAVEEVSIGEDDIPF